MPEHERFLDIAGGDPALATMLQESLKRLEEGAAGPQLQAFARDVLSGQMHIRDAVAQDDYAAALGQRMAEFQQWQQEVGDQEVNRLGRQAEQYAAELREELERESGRDE